ncbi:MAG TPA: sigma-70 family RNA polymerase sigma factor [Gemmatimonadaceae bacterium]|nr:sigma-70 family RNA polymerase sigma factor [Gemmatimonadaceae bacterium]
MDPNEPTDAELVNSVRAGDVRAFDVLVRRHERAAWAVAYALVHDGTEAEDLAQEAFVRAFRNLDMLADPGKFAAWLRRIVVGVSIDWMRAYHPELYRADGDGHADPLAHVASPDPSPLERLEQLELVDRVRVALARLPARSRAPLALYHLDGLSQTRIAAALGVPEGTVRSLVTRARQALAPLLADYARDGAGAAEVGDAFDEEPASPRSILHVLNGDCMVGTLRGSGVPGDLAVWADVLHEGPLPRNASAEEWRRVRARYATSRGYASYDEALAMHERWDAGLASADEHDEVVLWFEHDLFDQTLLMHHLDHFARRETRRCTLSLICIGEYPGVERFIGLGQLTSTQLASLYGTRQRLSEEQLRLGRNAWAAYCAAKPTGIERLLERDTSALPFLGAALRRHLEEFPAVRTGVPRTEGQILRLLAESPYSPAKLFIAAQALEERPYLGDTSYWWRVLRMAEGPDPLVALDLRPSPQSLPEGEVRITHTGLRVLAGDDDWMRLLPFDRRIGGARVRSSAQHWRWDAEARRLVEAGAVL